MYDLANGRWWDITTSTQWAAHQAKCGDIYGQRGVLLPTNS
jgi:hypothetical protein